VASIISIILDGIEESARKYHGYGRHNYGMPIDEMEQDRNDLQHHKFKLIIGGVLHLVPLSTELSSVLNLEVGSGIWAIGAADKYPSAIVKGVDIAAV
jgi:hypothetical protein